MSGHEEERREDYVKMALLIQSVTEMKESNNEGHEVLFKELRCITNSIKGKDSNPGMLTRIALVEESVFRIWFWLGGISISILAAAIFIVRVGVAG